MGDHAPASEARNNCDRKFGDIKLVYNKNLCDAKVVYNESCI